MSRLTHLNQAGEAQMVDITAKAASHRVAVATATVCTSTEVIQLIADNAHAKGDVLAVARIAGIQAAKKCADLIPLCHPLALTSVAVDFELRPAAEQIVITATCKVSGQTGVEMEALTAASVSALTIYDMCKAVDKGMVIEKLQLLEKPAANPVIGSAMMDSVTVILFASLREQLNTANLAWPVPVDGQKVSAVIDQLADSHGSQWREVLLAENVLVAVNQQLCDHSARVFPGDELAFFPPMTGG